MDFILICNKSTNSINIKLRWVLHTEKSGKLFFKKNNTGPNSEP